MAVENVKRFYDDVLHDDARLGELSTYDEDQLIAYANENGYAFSKADLDAYAQTVDKPAPAVSNGACACAFGGGGSTGELHCACVLCGFGGTPNDLYRCRCVIGGVGSI